MFASHDQRGRYEGKGPIRELRIGFRRDYERAGKGPQNIMDKAECIIIIPSVLKGAFLVGGSYGRGAMTCRTGEVSVENGAPQQ